MSRSERKITLNRNQAREIARYEKTFMDYCEDPEDELHVTFEEPYQFTVEDLAEAVTGMVAIAPAKTGSIRSNRSRTASASKRRPG